VFCARNADFSRGKRNLGCNTTQNIFGGVHNVFEAIFVMKTYRSDIVCNVSKFYMENCKTWDQRITYKGFFITFFNNLMEVAVRKRNF
jgi:hypothetical protein